MKERHVVAAYWLLLGVLLWILADVHVLAHGRGIDLDHDGYTALGVGAFIVALYKVLVKEPA